MQFMTPYQAKLMKYVDDRVMDNIVNLADAYHTMRLKQESPGASTRRFLLMCRLTGVGRAGRSITERLKEVIA
jgi:hypothetical protein